MTKSRQWREDQGVPIFAGMMGHRFAVVASLGTLRRLHGETDSIEEAVKWCNNATAGAAMTIYERKGDGYVTWTGGA